MPVYEYACKSCEIDFDKFHKTMDAKKPACPECGKKRPVQRLVTQHAHEADSSTR